jgi:hypothetical protein
MKRWREHYNTTPGAGAIVDEAIREWYAQVLVETVLGAESLRGSRWWSDRDLEQLTSEVALTTAIQPRYFIEERLKRDLARELGRAVKAAA